MSHQKPQTERLEAHMIKVILYGVKNLELRRSIEYFLDDNYEIIGYSDGHYKSDVLDGKTFFLPEELNQQEYDYILISAGSAPVQAEIQRGLLANGIPPDKIIKPIMLSGKGGEKGQADLISEINNHYQGEDGLIFGLSYSAWGVLEKELHRPFFNLSWSGLDLYYNFRLYKYMEERKILSRVKTALFVIPYYYFNYDMSRCISQYVSGQIFSVWRLNDWHRAQEVPGAWEYIENYHMFGEKISQFYHMPKWKGPSPYTLGVPDGASMADSLWFTDHEITIKENQELLFQFLKSIKEKGGNSLIVVPPFYLDGFNQVSRAAISAKKEKFYRALGEIEAILGPIKVFDYIDKFSGRRELFRETTHLNSRGSTEFTKLIDTEVLD